MITARLIDDDWTFGQGKAGYISGAEAIYQNVKTRLRSFKYDWFLDTQANIDWVALLGSRSNQSAILKEVERVTLNTQGVSKIIKLESTLQENRGIKIMLRFVTIYDTQHDITEVVE